jgi:hypothetical protein
MNENDPARVRENDLRKLHAEILQIVTQRFNLTTLAVVVFAAICGWTVSLVGKDQPVKPELVTLVV